MTPTHVSSTAASAVLGASHSSSSIVNEEEVIVREAEETQPEVIENEEALAESEEPQVEEEVHEVVEETGSELQREDEREEPVPTYDEVAVQSDHPAENVTETETETAAKTYSDIVKRLAAAESKTVANGNGPTYRVVRTVVTAPPSTEAAPTAVKGGDVPSGSKNHRGTSTSGQQVYAVYIAPLPEGATEQVIAEAFSVFGNVVQVDFTRGRKYGFVKFDTPTAMQAALDYEEVFEVNGVRLQIEEKTSPKPKGDGFTRRKDRERVGGEKGEKSPRSGKSNEFNRKSNGRKEGGERGSANGKVNSNNNNNNHQQQTQTATSQVKNQRK